MFIGRQRCLGQVVADFPTGLPIDDVHNVLFLLFVGWTASSRRTRSSSSSVGQMV